MKKNIIILSNNSTIPEKIRVADIEAFNRLPAKGTHALQKLIDFCKEMDQRLALKADFIKARDAIECVVCHREVGLKSNLDSDGRCNSCVKELVRKKRAEETKAALLENWKQLEKSLLILGTYTFVDNALGKMVQRTIQKQNESITFNIYREPIYRGGAWHQRITGYALRISSNKSGLESARLKRDFDDKDIAKYLHDKIEVLVDIYKAKMQRQDKQKDENSKFIRMIVEDLGVANTAIECHYVRTGHSPHSFAPSTSTKKVLYRTLCLSTRYSSATELLYHVTGVEKAFTANQIKEIAELVDTF